MLRRTHLTTDLRMQVRLQTLLGYLLETQVVFHDVSSQHCNLNPSRRRSWHGDFVLNTRQQPSTPLQVMENDDARMDLMVRFMASMSSMRTQSVRGIELGYITWFGPLYWWRKTLHKLYGFSVPHRKLLGRFSRSFLTWPLFEVYNTYDFLVRGEFLL